MFLWSELSLRLKLVIGAACAGVIFSAGFYAGFQKEMVGRQHSLQEARMLLSDRYVDSGSGAATSRYVLGAVLRNAEREGVKLDPVEVAESIARSFHWQMRNCPTGALRLDCVNEEIVLTTGAKFGLGKDEETQ